MRTFLVIAALAMGLPASLAAQGSLIAQTRDYFETNKPDLALSYQYMRSNTQPSDCGCFGLKGTGLSASWRLNHGLSAVVEGDMGFASNGPGTGNSLTLFSFVGGARYKLPLQLPIHRAPQLFAEAMSGFGHAGGGIAGAGDGSFAFVGRVGGGFDEVVAEPFAVRFEADYVPTTFANGMNNHQNNFLVAVGIVFHWSRPH